MNNELEIMWKEMVVELRTILPQNLDGELKTNTESWSEYQSPVGDLNPRPPNVKWNSDVPSFSFCLSY